MDVPDPQSAINVANSEPVTAAYAWIERHKNFNGYVNGHWLTSPVDPAAVVQATHDALKRETTSIAEHLYALSQRIQGAAPMLAVLDSLDSGQPIKRSQKLSVPLAVRYAEYYIGWALRTDDERSEWPDVGVVILELAAVPVLLVDLLRQALWAIAEGNVVVISAPPGNCTALVFADLCAQAAFPPGIVNVVMGDIVSSHWHLPRRALITLEQAPTVVIFDNASLDSAVDSALTALWFNPDRTRRSIVNLIVQDGVVATVLAKLQKGLAAAKTGGALDRTIDISTAQSSGGPIAIDVGQNAIVRTFRTLTEAADLVNICNAATVSFWTESIGAAIEFAHEIKTTTIWVNAIDLFDPALDNQILPRRVEARPRPILWIPTAGQPERQQLESLYINGQFVRSGSGETRLIGGANHRVLAEISIGGKVDLDRAVSAATAASAAWAATSSTDRIRLMYRLADLMRQHKRKMADSIAARTGESRLEAEEVVDLRIEQLLAATAAAENIARSQQLVRYMPNHALALTVPEPIGVLGVVDPVSLLYELAQVIGKVLANRATAVIIPSERYPLTALAFCELLTLAEIPPGVINVVPGDQGKLIAALAEHKNVAIWQPSGPQPLPVHVKTIWLPYGAQNRPTKTYH